MNTGDIPVIHFENADITNGETSVIYGLNMDVMSGEFVYITGKVGTGKSSIVHTLTAEVPLGAGSASVCGYDLTTIRRSDIPQLRRKMGVVFQDFKLLTDRSVEDNLAFVLKATGWKNLPLIDERIREVLGKVDMSTKSHRFPHQLSGGEQQRVCIARAMLNNPGLIIADEPTGNLDNETAESIMQLLREINAAGTTILMVTHRQSIIERYPGRVFHCEKDSCSEKTQQ